MKTTSPVPIYNLQERTKGNFEIIEITENQDIAHRSEAHRDNNYLLIYQQQGISKVMVDFKEITIFGSAIFCILPGQIHYGISLQKAHTWAIAVDATWIKDTFRMILMDFTLRNTPLSIEPTLASLLGQSLDLLQKLDYRTKTAVTDQSLHAMLDVCLSLFVSASRNNNALVSQEKLRPGLITRQFRNMLLTNFREIKSPSQYAELLHISPAYLNEVVKQTTGNPVSYWIHQEVMLEAKRMLFYTNSTVKEIAHNLGYSDATYFIRLFGKIAGLSPLQFRQKYHE